MKTKSKHPNRVAFKRDGKVLYVTYAGSERDKNLSEAIKFLAETSPDDPSPWEVDRDYKG